MKMFASPCMTSQMILFVAFDCFKDIGTVEVLQLLIIITQPTTVIPPAVLIIC